MRPTRENAMRKDKATGKFVQLQHRHYACIAAIIAEMPDDRERYNTAVHFGRALRQTNLNFDYDRFIIAALPV